MMKRKFFSRSYLRWIAIAGMALTVLVVASLALVQVYARSLGNATQQVLSLMVVGADFCLVVGTTGLLFGLNRLWSAGLLKKDAISQNNLIAWVVVLAIGLPWLASGFLSKFELVLFGNMGASPSNENGLLAVPAAYYLLQALIMAIMVYALVLKPGRLTPGFIAPYRGGVWPLVAGGLFGLAGWLAGIFLQRIELAIFPRAWGELLAYLAHLSIGSLGHLNWMQVLIMLVLAPLADELFLRGYVFPEWTHIWGKGIGLIATAVLSGLLALSPTAFPIVFLFSISLCWLAGRVKHLAPVWVAHLVFISLFLFLMPN